FILTEFRNGRGVFGRGSFFGLGELNNPRIGTAGTNHIRAARITEIPSDGQLFLAGSAFQNPQQQKERHHGGHEVRKGYLPGATVCSMAAAFLLADDNDRLSAFFHPGGLYFLARYCSSSSLKLGRTLW